MDWSGTIRGIASENLEKVPQKKFHRWLVVILIILIFGIVIYYLFIR